jgi:hypothetical protein
MVLKAPTMNPREQEALAAYLRTTKIAILPPSATIEYVRTKSSTPPLVTTTGISCRVGVGGRRGRKRRRAEERREGGTLIALPPMVYSTRHLRVRLAPPLPPLMLTWPNAPAARAPTAARSSR